MISFILRRFCSLSCAKRQPGKSGNRWPRSTTPLMLGRGIGPFVPMVVLLALTRSALRHPNTRLTGLLILLLIFPAALSPAVLFLTPLQLGLGLTRTVLSGAYFHFTGILAGPAQSIPRASSTKPLRLLTQFNNQRLSAFICGQFYLWREET